MLDNYPTPKNPLMLLGYASEDILPEGGFGAVLASAGVGKTALMVQLALYAMIRSKNVLHISLDDPVNKVALWYKEVFQNISTHYNFKQATSLWEAILPHRFIMTFKVGGFSAPILEERLDDLTEQNIFSPGMAIIDGLPFDESVHGALIKLKAIVKARSMYVWFTVRTHHHEAFRPGDIPLPLLQVADLFEVAIQIKPEGNETHVKALIGGGKHSEQPSLILDPSTMLLKEYSKPFS